MTTPALPSQTLEGPDSAESAARLQRRLYQAWLRQGQGARRRRPIVLSPADAVLIACLSLCLFAVCVGLDRMYPVVRPGLIHALVADLPPRPYPDCAQSHDAGIYDIPAGTPAYSRDQDDDGDGVACEH